MTNQIQYLSLAVPMLLPHPDGSYETIAVNELRPIDDQWMVAQDEALRLRWLMPRPPVRDVATGLLIAECEASPP